MPAYAAFFRGLADALTSGGPLPVDPMDAVAELPKAMPHIEVPIQAGDDEVSATPDTNFTVLRVKRNVLRRSSVGGIYTRRSVSTVGDGANDRLMKEIADLHAALKPGGRIFIQLMHAGRMSHPDNTPHHRQAVAPSAIAPASQMFTATGMQEIPAPRALSTEDIHQTVADFRHAARAANLPAIADDSGIEVDALKCAPGIYSARWAGPPRSDERNNELLLAQLHDVPDARRTAHFTCAVALVHPDGRELVVEGRMDGTVTRAVRGSGGFGYDVLFVSSSRVNLGLHQSVAGGIELCQVQLAGDPGGHLVAGAQRQIQSRLGRHSGARGIPMGQHRVDHRVREPLLAQHLLGYRALRGDAGRRRRAGVGAVTVEVGGGVPHDGRLDERPVNDERAGCGLGPGQPVHPRGT